MWNRALGPVDVAALYSQTPFTNMTSVLLPPVIGSQPADVTVYDQGGSATFGVTTTIGAALNYQWFLNTNTTIIGATNSTLTISNVQFGDLGSQYSVRVANVNGSAMSSLATLWELFITKQPTNLIVNQGGQAVFNVNAFGQPLKYQWQLNGVNLTNIITSVAGCGSRGAFGDGGFATNASLSFPQNVTMDIGGNIYVVDTYNALIRKVDTNGIISTLAGNGSMGYSGDGGLAVNAKLYLPGAAAVDPCGNLIIADTFNNCLRKVDAFGVITTVAGNGLAGYSGDGGLAVNARLNAPNGLAFDLNGNLYVSDANNNCIRKIDVNGIITTVAGNGVAGFAGDGGAATNASLNAPGGIVLDSFGNLFIADSGNNRVRRVDLNGIITTLAGSGMLGYFGDGGFATNASFTTPCSLALDGMGNLFIADTYNNCIRRVCTNGVIDTVAGSPSSSTLGDGGAATNASLFFPSGIVISSAGTLMVADAGNNVVRQINLTDESKLVLNRAQLTDAGNYSVIVSNPHGSLASSNAMLTVLPTLYSPTILSQPTNASVVLGSNVTFSVAVTGTTPMSYQWYFNTIHPILNETNSALNLMNVQLANMGNYQVIVSNLVGNLTSSNGLLTVIAPPVITQPPTNVIASQGGMTSLSVTATGSAPLTYQWFINGNRLPNGTASSLIIQNTQPSDAANYFVVVGNSVGSVTSSVVSINVLQSPAIITHPVSQVVSIGVAVTNCVVATGAQPLSYQWQLNGTNLNGATNALLILNNMQPINLGVYDVVVTNVAGAVTSSPAFLITSNSLADSDYDGINDAQEIANHTDPFSPGSVSPVRLGYWSFDNTNNWVGNAGQLPLLVSNLVGVPSWNTNGVLVDSTNVTILRYRDVETNGNANINLRCGTIRLWFKPDWSSVNAGGTGPQAQGRLVEMGQSGTNTGWWTVMFDTNGGNLSLITQTNGLSQTNLCAPIIWNSNVWHQVVLTYDSNNSQLYVDGQVLVTNGLSVQYWPNSTERAAGFCLGSDNAGNNQARGVFDELETFNCQLAAADIQANYQSMVALDSDGDGMSNIAENQQGLNPYGTNSLNGLNSGNTLQVFTPLK